MDVSKTFLQQLAARSQDLTFVYDYNTDSFAYLSDTAQDFFGMPVEKIYESPELLVPLLQVEDRQYVLEQINNLRNGVPYLDAEFRLFLPDQTTKWLYGKAYTLFNADLKGSHMVGIIEDKLSEKNMK